MVFNGYLRVYHSGQDINVEFSKCFITNVKWLAHHSSGVSE